MSKRTTIPRNADESPADLRHLAETLERIAKSLKDTAERMDRAGVHTINVRCGFGTDTAITNTITPFAQDAERKVKEAGG